jgi:hypothetical protein
MKSMAAVRDFTAFVTVAAILGLPIAAAAAQAVKAPAKNPAAPKTAPADENATWLLAGREGECAPVSILERKGPEFKGIKGPNPLADKLRAMGHKVDVKEFKAGTRPAVEVRAPSAGIAVMFVKKDFCDKVAPEPDKK